MFGPDGAPLGDIALPGTGTVGGVERARRWPGHLVRVHVAADAHHDSPVRSRAPAPTRTFEAATPPVDASAYETRALFATSKDGTRVPLFVTAKKGHGQGRQQPDDGLRLRRLLGERAARLPARRARVARARRHLGDGEPARRRRVRRGLAPGRHARAEAERLRRLHRRARVPGAREVHLAGAARDHGRLERRPARGRRDGAAAGPDGGGAARRRRDGHAALRPVHRRPLLDHRVRVGVEPGAVPVPRSSTRRSTT